jgi:hypothetical protein
MRKLYEKFHIIYFQKRIISAATIRRNTVNCMGQKIFTRYRSFLNRVRDKFCRNPIGDFSQNNFLPLSLGLPPTPISSVIQTKLSVVSKHLLYAAFLLPVARARRDCDVVAGVRGEAHEAV